jgi:hypothetical protein
MQIFRQGIQRRKIDLAGHRREESSPRGHEDNEHFLLLRED